MEDIEDITLYVLNDKNKLVTSKFIEGIMKRYGFDYKVRNLDLFQLALTHKSYLRREILAEDNKNKHWMTKDREVEPIKNADKAIPLRTESYERSEWYGDAVIHLALTEYLFARYPNENEGFLTKLRSKLENTKSLANLTKIIGLNEYVLISNLIESQDGRYKNNSILEDVFEAFISALVHDSKDREMSLKFVKVLLETEINIPQLLHQNDNYKDLLLQYYHKQKWDDPSYDLLDQSGPDNKREFTMCVKNNDGIIVGTGSGTTKKHGEQEAARNALIFFGEIQDGSDSETEEVLTDSSLDGSSDESDEETDSDEEIYTASTSTEEVNKKKYRKGQRKN